MAHLISNIGGIELTRNDSMKTTTMQKRTTTTTTVLRPSFRDHPCEPVPEENFWCKGRLTDYPVPTSWPPPVRNHCWPNNLKHLNNKSNFNTSCLVCYQYSMFTVTLLLRTGSRPAWTKRFSAIIQVNLWQSAPPAKKWRTLLKQNFTTQMPLLTSNSTSGLDRRR